MDTTRHIIFLVSLIYSSCEKKEKQERKKILKQNFDNIPESK